MAKSKKPKDSDYTAGQIQVLKGLDTAIMLRGMEWILNDGAAEIKPGFYDFPKDLELEIAQRTVDSRA